MRIDGSREPALVISPVGVPAPARSFREHLLAPARAPRLKQSAAQTLLGEAWTQVVGSAPDARTAALLTAHWALETDAGRAMPGHNFAGIKASPAAPGALLRTVEGHGATRHEVSARFRVYDSAEAGALDYVHLLQARFPAALAAAQRGNTEGFARALAAGGYFTADPQVYAAGLLQRLADIEAGSVQPGSFRAPNGASGVPARGTVAEAALGGLLHALRDADAGRDAADDT